MPKFCVISDNLEDGGILVDFVVADDAEKAVEWMEKARDYAGSPTAFTAEGVRALADELESISEASILEEMAEFDVGA